jgi:hypothetical protein
MRSIPPNFSSLIVVKGLRIAGRQADEDYPFGYGKAESLAAAVVSMLLIGAAIGIAVEAVREILTPHHTPAPFTLAVLVGVIVIKEILFRRVSRVGEEVASTPCRRCLASPERCSHLAGSLYRHQCLIGGPGWEAADDWAASRPQRSFSSMASGCSVPP